MLHLLGWGNWLLLNMTIGTWKSYENLDFVIFYKIFFSLQTFDIFTPHLILNIFPTGSMPLGPTVVKIKVGQVERVDALYVYVCRHFKKRFFLLFKYELKVQNSF